MNYSSIPTHAVARTQTLRSTPINASGKIFLQDRFALEKIANAAEIQADDCVLEIGRCWQSHPLGCLCPKGCSGRTGP